MTVDPNHSSRGADAKKSIPGFAIANGPDWTDIADRSNFATRALILEMCVRLSLRVPGNIIEFGVATGDSTRVIRRTLKRYGRRWFIPFGRKQLFACDSWEGLPEAWENVDVGGLACEPPRIPGVRFVKGYFQDTLTEQLRREVGHVAFAHFDADLYSSTKVALEWIAPLLTTGSLLLFDQFIGGDMDEFRAFDEWRKSHGIQCLRLAEFDREPAGNGKDLDRRLLFQVVANEKLSARYPRDSLPWVIGYYLGRLGLHELQSRLEHRY